MCAVAEACCCMQCTTGHYIEYTAVWVCIQRIRFTYLYRHVPLYILLSNMKESHVWKTKQQQNWGDIFRSVADASHRGWSSQAFTLILSEHPSMIYLCEMPNHFHFL